MRSLKRRVLFALAAVTIAFTIPFVTLLAADVHLHRKYEKSAGFNIWGYRGPVAPRKKAGEYRVVVLGGSAAYGYGVNWDEAIPAGLERGLEGRQADPIRSFKVINLGYNNEGAFSFKYTLQDYLWLNYDLACLYEGYNDLMGDPRGPNLSVFRHTSPVFRLTGYLPIFPMIFREKAGLILHGGDVDALYRELQARDGSKTVFRPGLAAKTAAGVLTATADIGQSLERQLGRVAAEPRHEITDVAATGCKSPWEQYCRSVLVAVEFAVQHDKQVLVVTQPYGAGPIFRARHSEQQREMAAMLARRFGSDPRVNYVNLGDQVALEDPALSFDQMHLTVAGNARVAAGLVEPVLEMAARRTRHQ
jgi:hypothetical protein